MHFLLVLISDFSHPKSDVPHTQYQMKREKNAGLGFHWDHAEIDVYDPANIIFVGESELNSFGPGVAQLFKKFNSYKTLQPTRTNHIGFVWNGIRIRFVLFRILPDQDQNPRFFVPLFTDPIEIIRESGNIEDHAHEVRVDSQGVQRVLIKKNLFKVCCIFLFLKRNQGNLDGFLDQK